MKRITFQGIKYVLLFIEIVCPNEPNRGGGLWIQRPRSYDVGAYQVFWCLPGFIHPSGEFGTSVECRESTSNGIPHDWDRSVPQCLGRNS